MDHSVANKKRAGPRNIFMGTGTVLLVLLCAIPLWNAFALLNDSNYVFWCGRMVPLLMMFICVAIIGFYVLTALSFFNFARSSVQTELSVMMIANVFVTMLGVALMLVALPLSKQALDTHTNLMHHCDYSEQTHRLFEYSQVLQNIRQGADCKDKFSVEECKGYQDVAPYTDFLKVLENDFRCSGFCYRPRPLAPLGPPTMLNVTDLEGIAAAEPAVSGEMPTVDYLKTPAPSEGNESAAVQTAAPAAQTAAPAAETAASAAVAAVTVAPQAPAAHTTPAGISSSYSNTVVGDWQDAPSKALAFEQNSRRARRHQDHITPLGMLAPDLPQDTITPLALLQTNNAELDGTARPKLVDTRYPPTLFSDANYQASCEGMSARDMRNFAGDVGFQIFYQGMYLILIAIATGFLKLLGFCIRRDHDSEIPSSILMGHKNNMRV